MTIPTELKTSSRDLKLRVLIIIPAYNEEDAITGTLTHLRSCLKGQPHEYVPLVVNDGSKDKTVQIVRDLGELLVDLPYNMGIGNTVHTGYLYALRHAFDVAIQFDGDGQHPAESIPKLVERLAQGEADVVIGSRYISNAKEGFQSSAARRMGITIISKLLAFFGSKVADPTSGFRAINKKGIDCYTAYYPHDFPEPEAIMWGTRQGLRIVEEPVIMKERQGGVSSIRHWKTLYYMTKVSLAICLTGLLRSVPNDND